MNKLYLILINKRISFISIIRGWLYNLLFLKFKSSGLRIHNNVHLQGHLKFGNNCIVSKFSKLYNDNTLGDNVYIGDNVELRCNQENKINIGDNCTINRNTIIMGTVSIGKDCLIAPTCIIVGSNHNFDNINIPINKQGINSKGITIEDNVWIGASCIILDGVTIGANTIIGAGALVTKSIPADSIAVGSPCKVIKRRI